MNTTLNFQSKSLIVETTDNVPISAILDAFSEEGWSEIVDIKPPRLLLSVDPTAWIDFISEWKLWQQLLGAGGAAIITGYLHKAGSNLWDNQFKLPENAAKVFVSFVLRLNKLKLNLENKTIISIGGKSKNNFYSILLNLEEIEFETTLYKIAVFCYHSKNIEIFVNSQDFDPITNSQLSVNEDGSITLNWCDKTSNQIKSKTFSVNNSNDI